MMKSAVSQRHDSRLPPQACPVELKRYHTIGQASCEVYEALSKACTKHTEHQAHFYVKVEQEVAHGCFESQIKFNMAFTHLTSPNSTHQDDFLWFVVSYTTGSDYKNPRIEGMADGSGENLAQSLKRQMEPSQTTIAKKQKKNNRFHASTPAPPPPVHSLAVISIPSSLKSVDSRGGDL